MMPPRSPETPLADPGARHTHGKAALLLLVAAVGVGVVIRDGGMPGPGYLGRAGTGLGTTLAALSVACALVGRGRLNAERLRFALVGAAWALLGGGLLGCL